MGKLVRILSFLPAIVFPFAAYLTGWRNPGLFDVSAIANTLPLFLVLFTILGLLATLRVPGSSARASSNLPGLALFSLFTVGYFLFASLLNKPDLNTNNIYFAADSWSWYLRMAAEDGWKTEARAVHPLAYIIFRPLIAGFSLLTGGDRFHASLVIVALTGGGCVFLMWKIAGELSKNEEYAVLTASLLGISASHMLFASIIETYIFSSFCLLLFIWLLLDNKKTYLLTATSVVTLGITITNVVQQALTSILVQRNIRRSFFLFSAVIVVGIGLNILSHALYPTTEYFFLPRNLGREERFVEETNIKRAGLMLENLVVYSVAAPEPYLGRRNEMPRFNFLNSTIKEYMWFGWPALVFWIAILFLASFRFIKHFNFASEDTHLAVAMLGCLAFNFLLHIGYGTEVFLYSADWTYALILFVTVALKGMVQHTWFNMALFTAVLLIMVNNLWVIYFIARQVNPFLA